MKLAVKENQFADAAVFHLLPHDVLYQIFVLCVKTTPDPWFPVVLSQVCRSWRFTALASPILWTTIVLRLCRPRQRHLRPKAFLERSRGLPIYMHVHVHRSPKRHECTIVSSHATRLRALILTSRDRELAMDSVGYFFQMPFRSLAFFHVFVPGQVGFQVIRKPHSADPFFTPSLLSGPSFRDFLWFRWNVRNVTALILKGLGSADRPFMRHMWKMLHECSGTLRHLDFEGWAPTNDLGSSISPVVLQALRYLRIGYIDDMSSLAACIHAPNLDVLVLHDVLFCPAMLPQLESTTIAQCNLPLIFQLLAPSCTRLRQLTFIGVDACPRDAVDAFFGGLPAVIALTLSLCHPVFSDALFQPEARYRVPKAILPKLSHLNVSLSRPTDLARFLLRHKTVDVPPLKRIDVTRRQFSEAYGRPGICDILGVVLKIGSEEGVAVGVLEDPRIYIISQVVSAV
ncbi:hypothetical protein DFH06DRAFT_1477919 [Mycena polygramma]|nr:hypothetical protein DFH06DRAFT_1477919 [Mycena polygramma]